MKLFLLLLIFFSANSSFAQIGSELTPTFQDEIDTVLEQLHRKDISSFNILIKPNRHGYLGWVPSDYENYHCRYINDSIIKLETVATFGDSIPDTNVYVDYCYFKSGQLTKIDEPPFQLQQSDSSYIIPKSFVINLHKDSLGYSVENYYVINCDYKDTSICNDTATRSYDRKKFDDKKQLISWTHILIYGSHTNDHFETKIFYPDSLTTIEKCYNYEKYDRFLYYTKVLKIKYNNRSKETIEKIVWYPDFKLKYRSNQVTTKTTYYNSDLTVKSADYREKSYQYVPYLKNKSGLQLIINTNKN